jgi:hypothetical protein
MEFFSKSEEKMGGFYFALRMILKLKKWMRVYLLTGL